MKVSSMELSLWEQEVQFSDCELAVVGAGLTGLQAAINYCRKRTTKGRVVLLDLEAFIRRASTRNAGFAVFGSLSEILDDIDQMGYDRAMKLVGWRARSLQKLLNESTTELFDYQPVGGIELFLDDQDDLLDQSRAVMEDVNKSLKPVLGNEVFRYIKDPDIYPFEGVRAAIENPFEGLLHPGKLVRVLEEQAMEAGAEIRTGVQVQSIESDGREVRLLLDGEIELKAERVLVAANGLAGSLLQEEDIRPARNVIAVTNNLSRSLPPKAYHCERGYLYFRPVNNNRLLIGGGRHWSEEGDLTDELVPEQLMIDRLMDFARPLLNDRNIHPEMSWAGTLGVGKDRMPLLKKSGERVIACIRMGGMGVALSASLGEQAAEMLLDI